MDTKQEETQIFIHREKILDEQEKREVYEILEECDQDFCPPLSYRSSTSQKQLTQVEDGKEGVRRYYEEILQQPTLLVKREGRTIGFMSYRIGYTCKELEHYGKVGYLTTLCIRPSERGRRLAPLIYRAVESHIYSQYPDLVITLRTWSTNKAQLHLMDELGYHCVARLENDRGEGIDTVYYAKEPDKKIFKNY